MREDVSDNHAITYFVRHAARDGLGNRLFDYLNRSASHGYLLLCFVPHRCITATLQVRAYLATICPIKPCHTRFAHSLGCIALHSINNPLGPKDLIQLNIMSLAKRSRAIQERVVASNKPLPLCALLKHLCHAQGQNT